MEAFSVQNLQALVIVAFDIVSKFGDLTPVTLVLRKSQIGSGRGPSAWSVVGSMARTAEQLQLNVEDSVEEELENKKQLLINRMAFLRSPTTWVEAEERRRVFWMIFLMDRFCSVATGYE